MKWIDGVSRTSKYLRRKLSREERETTDSRHGGLPTFYICCHLLSLLSWKYTAEPTILLYQDTKTLEWYSTAWDGNIAECQTLSYRAGEITRIKLSGAIAGSHSSAIRCVSSSLIFQNSPWTKEAIYLFFSFCRWNNGCVPFTDFLLFLLSSSVGHITSSSVIGTTKEMLRLSISGREPEFALGHKIIGI